MEKKILTDRQLSIIGKIGANKTLASSFYLTGGTALAGFYLHHRYSEDLDFFSEAEFDVGGITVFLSGIKKDMKLDQIDYQQSMNRNLYFLHFEDEVLKMEFTYYPFPRIEETMSSYGIAVDSLLDIAVNKLFAIYQRSTARDYIDLYCICKKEDWQVAELIKKARVKFDWHIDPLQLGTQFLKSEAAEDFPRMIEQIQPEEWRAFFREAAKRLKEEIVN